MSPSDPGNGRVDWLKDELDSLGGKVETQSIAINAMKTSLDLMAQRFDYNTQAATARISQVERAIEAHIRPCPDFTAHVSSHKAWTKRLTRWAAILALGLLLGGGGTTWAFLPKLQAILTILSNEVVEVRGVTPNLTAPDGAPYSKSLNGQ